MAIARGVAKKVAYKKESTWGTLPGATGASYLRRVTSTFNLNRETYESNEIRTDFQTADMRLGLRSVEGTLNGELSAGSYADFMAAVVAKDFTAVTAITGLSVTIAASGTLFTIARSAGSWITDNVKVGHVLSLTSAGLNVANQSNNVLVAAVTALTLTVAVLSATPLVAEGPIASTTATIRGKTTEAPLTGHTDNSFTVEEWYSDIAQSEAYTGCKVGSVAITVPTSGLVTIDTSFMGRDRTSGTAQYFTTPTAANTEGIFSSVSGLALVNGLPVALITNLDFTISRNMEAANVIASNTAADLFAGRITVAGNFSTYFTDQTFKSYFENESEISILVSVAESNAKNADVVTFLMPRVKLGSATKNDGENGITQDHSFSALLNNVNGNGNPLTTIQIVDTSLV